MSPVECTDWRQRAVCAETPELFFPVSEQATATIAQAKSVCAGCPVRQQCLTWALNTAAPEGIWGGTTEGERRRLRRKQKAQDNQRTSEITEGVQAA